MLPEIILIFLLELLVPRAPRELSNSLGTHEAKMRATKKKLINHTQAHSLKTKSINHLCTSASNTPKLSKQILRGTRTYSYSLFPTLSPVIFFCNSNCIVEDFWKFLWDFFWENCEGVYVEFGSWLIFFKIWWKNWDVCFVCGLDF